MGDHIDIREKILQKNNQQYCEVNGEIWLPFLFDYKAFDRTFSVTLWARSKEEAEGLANTSLEYKGQLLQEIKF